MDNKEIAELTLKLVLNPENLDEYNTKDFNGNPQLIYESDDSIYFLTNNVNTGRFYFSRSKIGSVLSIDRITKMIFYTDVPSTRGDGTLQYHKAFKKICKKIISILKKHDYKLMDSI